MMALFKVTTSLASVALVYWAIILDLTASCAGDPEGFISIDCGSTRRYIDSGTNLTWERDEPYTLIGKDGAIPQSLGNTLNSSIENHEALKSFRYFPLSRKKYCYELPLRKSGTTFLIRAMFLHGHSSLLHPPIRFQIYINATRWVQVQYGMHNEYDFKFMKPEVHEGIYFNKHGRKVNFCLVPEIGVPFVSSLELREMDSVLYAEALTDGRWDRSLLLSALSRWNVAPAATPTVRYPDDSYDRLWTNSERSDLYLAFGSILKTKNVSTDSLKVLNNLPEKVTEDALEWNPGTYAVLSYPFNPTSGSLACFAFYFHGNQSTLGSSINIRTFTREFYNTTFKIANEATLKYMCHKVTYNWTNFIIINNSSTPAAPQLLALEVYLQDEIVDEAINDFQGQFVSSIKEVFSMSDWQGDPCVPKPYDWVTCYNDPDVDLLNFFVDSMTLSYQDNITELMRIPNDIFQQSIIIRSWSITHSNLGDNTLFYLLTEAGSYNTITYLNVSHNNITSNLFNSTRWEEVQNVTSAGLFAPFVWVKSFNLSHNHLSEAFLQKDLEVFFFSNLQDPQLQVLDISNNNMHGQIPPKFLSFLFNSTDIKTLIVDHNAITGTLNFTTWYHKMQATAWNSTRLHEIDNIFHHLFSFVSNDISNIIPSVKELESNMNVTLLIEQFNKFQGGLLLGGNPFCREATTLLHKYFCRTSTSDTRYGAFILLAGCLMSTIIWRLRRQVRVLQQFQQELLNRKVQPPFFSYHDLKIATKDFHSDKKLGSGAFGAVFKGVLQDKREIAVKKLFNSDKEVQVLNDFLNEVVLLTGIKHKNLVQLLGCCINDKERILVYEYADKGNVADALWGETAQLEETMLSWEERLNICAGVAWGLSYLHKELQPGIIHRDIKAANVLIDKNLNPKIADFGLAKLFREEETQAQFTFLAGTKGYLAPEYILDGVLTDKADVYSFGVLVLEIVSGRKCIDPTQSEDQVVLKHWAEVLQEQGELLQLLPVRLKEKCPPEEAIKVINIALLCVGRDPRLRPTMTEVAIMLSGTVDDALFLRLTEKRRSSDAMAVHFGPETGNQHDWISLIPWAEKSSTVLHTPVDHREEEDALIDSKRVNLSVASSSSVFRQSGDGAATATLQERLATVSHSLSRRIKLALDPIGS